MYEPASTLPPLLHAPNASTPRLPIIDQMGVHSSTPSYHRSGGRSLLHAFFLDQVRVVFRDLVSQIVQRALGSTEQVLDHVATGSSALLQPAQRRDG